MKVSEFIEKLKELPQDMEVCVNVYDDLHSTTYFEEAQLSVEKVTSYTWKGTKTYANKWSTIIPTKADDIGEDSIVVISEYA